MDDTILRDRDHNPAWTTATSASDGTLERRDFYCQNWRADVIALVNSSAAIQEHVRYGLAGEPFLISPADVTYSATNPSSGLGVPSGLVNSDDYFHFIDLWTAATNPRADFDHDGAVDNDDFLLYGAKWSEDSAKSWGAATLSNVASRKGYAGYENDRAVEKLWHVRYRVLDSGTGRWLKRDPLSFVDHQSLYSYCMSQVLTQADALGLKCAPCGCNCSGGGGSIGGGAGSIPSGGGFLNSPIAAPLPPGCYQRLQQALQDSRVREAFRRASAACGGTAVVRYKIKACGGTGDFGEFDCRHYGGDVTICLRFGMCPAPDDFVDTIVHELRHLEQSCRRYNFPSRCTAWRFRDCWQRTVDELEGWCSEMWLQPFCTNALLGDCADARYVCDTACGSVGAWCLNCSDRCVESFFGCSVYSY